MLVYAGDVSISVSSQYEQAREVSEVLIHDGFDAVSYMNDIALLRVSV